MTGTLGQNGVGGGGQWITTTLGQWMTGTLGH
jgi:hypothetical protein